jgi:D-threo-aldose 1-dehydrogenase
MPDDIAPEQAGVGIAGDFRDPPVTGRRAAAGRENLLQSHTRVPSIGYGAANLGNLYREVSDEQAALAVDAAWDAGIRYFDTAPHYGLGLSERRLGAALLQRPRDEFVISTKAGRLLRPNPEGVGTLDTAADFAVPADQKRVWDFSADGIRRSLEESLTRLGLDRVDILYLHDPERHDLEAALDTAIPALAALRDEGLVAAIGVGSMSTVALERTAATGALDLIMIAGRYTLAEQPVTECVLPACAANGVGIVVASVFNSGLLATDQPGLMARYDYGQVPAELLEHVQEIARVCAEHGVALPAAALQYPLRDPLVRSVVTASARPEQVSQNAEWMSAPIPHALWTDLAGRGLISA